MAGFEIQVPGRRQDLHPQRQAAGPRRPDRSLHRGRRHRPRHLARQRARARRRGRRRPTAASGRSPGWRSTPARRRSRKFEDLAARRDRRRLPRVPGRHQGPAHHADRRRHPLAQRRAAPDARSLRLPAAGALVQGRALAGQASREGRHGDLPREHRGHLRRHRVRGGLRGRQEVPRAPSARPSPRSTRKIRFPETPASASSRCREKAPSAWCAPRSSMPSPTSARA